METICLKEQHRTFLFFLVISSWGSNRISSNRLENNFNDWLKSKRKRLSKNEIAEKGYNIYKKRGLLTISKIIDDCLNQYYISKMITHDSIIINEKAFEEAYKVMIPDYELYSIWYDMYKIEISKYGRKNIAEESWLKCHFYNGKNPKYVASLGKGKIEEELETKIYKATKSNDKQYNLIIRPRLFLDTHQVNENIELCQCLFSIEKINFYKIFDEFNKPYPNKRWIVSKESFLIIPIDNKITEFFCSFEWLYNDISISHNVKINVIDKGKGNHICYSDGTFVSWDFYKYDAEPIDVLKEVRPNLIKYSKIENSYRINEDITKEKQYPYGSDFRAVSN